jgi:hypothetical protein
MLLYQKKLIEQHYQFMRCRIENNVLVCRGVIASPDYKNEYKVEIKCVYGCEPYTQILEPADIVPSINIHMYPDHSLCLHYPPDMRWSARTPISDYTIPWLVEWIVYYELYLVNGGKWEGPESPVHFTSADMNVAKNVELD